MATRRLMMASHGRRKQWRSWSGSIGTAPSISRTTFARSAGGAGYIECYNYVEGGICFLCGGTGHHHHKWVERTPEYEAILAERRVARARKDAPKRNAEFLAKMGFANGLIRIVLGDTYPIKDALKVEGARYSDVFGWYFGGETERETVTVTADELYSPDNLGTLRLRDDAKEIIEAKKREANPSKSEHLHEVGDKVDIKAKLVRIATYETHYTYYGEVNCIYTFEDADGNVYVWKTQADIDANIGDEVEVKGTVKENGEYKGVKQTVLTRAKVLDIKER